MGNQQTGTATAQQERFWNQVVWYNFIWCVLVILIHTQNTELFTGQAPVAAWLETLVVEKAARMANAGFFLCSGYLFYRDFSMERLPYKWKRRFFGVVLPFVVWNMVYYVLHLAIAAVPSVRIYFRDTGVAWNGREMFQAIVFCKYNPIFWFLQYLIVYICICPLIYALLRNRYRGLPVILAVLFLADSGVLSRYGAAWGHLANWLFVYLTGSYLGLHGRQWIENAENIGKTENPGKKARGACFSAAAVVLAALMSGARPGIAGTLVYYLSGAVLLWNILQMLNLPKARWWMRNTFFIYAAHFMIVRTGNKLAYACFGGWRWSGFAAFLLLPALAVGICGYLSLFLKRFTPFAWKVLSGDR